MLDDIQARGPLLALCLVAALAVLAGPVASPAAAHAGGYQLTLEASEDCQDRTYCFEVTEGNVEDLTAGGGEVHIRLENPESNDLNHNLYLTQIGDADPDRETEASVAEKDTEDLEPGEWEAFDYLVTDGSQGLYLWCDFGVHESQGMYIEIPFSEDAATDSSDETNDSPAPGALSALAALGAVAVSMRRGEP